MWGGAENSHLALHAKTQGQILDPDRALEVLLECLVDQGLIHGWTEVRWTDSGA
jgi:hypothetical protein